MAALELVERHAAQIMATARRYAATAEDAEDAYQRGLEIMLTKAPTTAEDELVPWLKTVIKHEAFALRRQRDRHTPTTEDGEPPDRPGGPPTMEQAERLERLQLGAEALQRLKPQEIRALVLRAEGHSYEEIAKITGWTYTKVSRRLRVPPMRVAIASRLQSCPPASLGRGFSSARTSRSSHRSSLASTQCHR
ncbi:MAG: sigma-70 family RNA polymerase sigma factor [Thermoleophilaceae bacterium]|nr:sigma-70 family RNA polymerase sigma factor [Thermoleophilaceae bacterium]